MRMGFLLKSGSSQISPSWGLREYFLAKGLLINNTEIYSSLRHTNETNRVPGPFPRLKTWHLYLIYIYLWINLQTQMFVAGIYCFWICTNVQNLSPPLSVLCSSCSWRSLILIEMWRTWCGAGFCAFWELLQISWTILALLLSHFSSTTKVVLFISQLLTGRVLCFYTIQDWSTVSEILDQLVRETICLFFF